MYIKQDEKSTFLYDILSFSLESDLDTETHFGHIYMLKCALQIMLLFIQRSPNVYNILSVPLQSNSNKNFISKAKIVDWTTYDTH